MNDQTKNDHKDTTAQAIDYYENLCIAHSVSEHIPTALTIGNVLLSKSLLLKRQLSNEYQYVRHIKCNTTSQPHQDHALQRNYRQSESLLVGDVTAEPVMRTTTITGHLPNHVFDHPGQPCVTEIISPDINRVDNIRFQTRSWWVMGLAVSIIFSIQIFSHLTFFFK